MLSLPVAEGQPRAPASGARPARFCAKLGVVMRTTTICAAGRAGAFAVTVAACEPVNMNRVSIPSPVDAADAVTTFMVVEDGGTELNPAVNAISDGSALETAAGGLLLKIAARAALTGLTGSEPCARAVTDAASTIGAVNNALSLAGVVHPVSGAIGAVVAFARYADDPGACPFALPPHRQQRALPPDNGD
jgi:hypothetical protein